jgi:hypothetical protein
MMLTTPFEDRSWVTCTFSQTNPSVDDHELTVNSSLQIIFIIGQTKMLLLSQQYFTV